MINNKALELIRQAGFYVDDDGTVWPAHPSCDVQEEMEKLIDLLINECVTVAHQAGEIIWDHDRMVDPRTFTGNNIWIHFGMDCEEDEDL
jgi:hypothetical protein